MRFGVASLQARVGDYPASNTRFLLEHDNWAGLIIDRGTEHVDLVKRTALGWRSAHSSTLYFGASISALEHWGREHGYRLVGSSSEGVNAFLVRDDVAGDLPGLAGAEAWRETLVRQARNSTGELTYFGGLAEQPAPIAEMPLIDVVTGRELLVSDLQ